MGFTRGIVFPLRHFLLILSLKFAIKEKNTELGKIRDFLKQKLSFALSWQGWTICIIGKFIDLTQSESVYSEEEEDDETANEETPDDEEPYDKEPYD